MIKHFCDMCGKEMASQDQGRIKIDAFNPYGKHLQVEIMTGLDGTMNGGDVCHACIYDAIRKHSEGR